MISKEEQTKYRKAGNYGFAITKYRIREKEFRVCIGLDEKRKMTDFHISPLKKSVEINSIYVGRIERRLPAVNACFVRIAPDQTCFLPFSEAKHPFYVKRQSADKELCEGDEILVQITRDGIKEKDPAASCAINVYGKYMVLTSAQKTFSISKKIEDESRERIRGLLDRWAGWIDGSAVDLEIQNPDLRNPDMAQEVIRCVCQSERAGKNRSFGIVVRTIAENVGDKELQDDFFECCKRFSCLTDQYRHFALYNCVYQDTPDYISYMKSALSSFQKDKKSCFLISDQDDIIAELEEYLPSFSADIIRYRDAAVSLSVLYNIHGNIEKLLQKKVWMNSGGNIVIEQLETLTVVDVNTAKSQSSKGDFYRVNLEAVDKILEQISLRNISGIIVIDFINMSAEDTDKLLLYLKTAVKRYPNPCNVIDVTKLGLVELTRKKIRKSVKEICQMS